MRLINVDDIVYESIDSSDTCRHESYYGTGILAVRKEDIDVMPTIKPELKKGKWNFIGDNMFECTYCGVAYTTQQLNGLRNYNVDPYAPKFCPNCGADMRGDQDVNANA